MIRSAIVKIVTVSARFRSLVMIAGTMVMVGAALFDVEYFSINTDVETLISPDLPWHQRQVALTRAFPQRGISAVVTAPTSENAGQAVNKLAQALAKNPKLFPTVAQPDSGEFFDRDGLLLAPTSDVRQTVAGLTKAEPILSQLSNDPSLRGIMKSYRSPQEKPGKGE